MFPRHLIGDCVAFAFFLSFFFFFLLVLLFSFVCENKNLH